MRASVALQCVIQTKKKIQNRNTFHHKWSTMSDNNLNHLIKRAASALPTVMSASLESAIMARVRTAAVRAQRWRSFV